MKELSMTQRVLFLLLLVVSSASPMLTTRRVSFCETPRVRHLISQEDLTIYQTRLKALKKELSVNIECIKAIRNTLALAHGNSAEALKVRLTRCCLLKQRLEIDIKAIQKTMANSVVC